MVEHFSLVCKSSKKSRKFYEAALKPLGYKCDLEYGDSFGFADAEGRHDFWVTKGKSKTPTHFAFLATSKKQIDEFHAAALKAGGEDNGKPGPREEYAGYAAFVHDLDGNNVEVVIWEGAPPKVEKPAKAEKSEKKSKAEKKSKKK
jgi:catechol 2,3-dioxygenase-like lactoylglutathione lyase family enzyme